MDDVDKLHGDDSDVSVDDSDDAIDDDEEYNRDRHGDDDDEHPNAADELDSAHDDADDSAVPVNCCFKDAHVARLTALYSWFIYDKTTGASSCMACSSYPATVAGPSFRSGNTCTFASPRRVDSKHISSSLKRHGADPAHKAAHSKWVALLDVRVLAREISC